ncbi:MAG: DUF177 domain-containing protein [Bacteroidales bacterium]|nr:DUF177 domain-containing protein [Bacteroidales bacterium]
MEYIIPLNGWAAGEREYRWQAGVKFFQKFDNAEILDAAVGIDARAVKSGHTISLDLDIRGSVTVACDRCLEDLTLPVEAHPAFRLEFGEAAAPEEETREGSREILYLDPSETEWDLSQVIYDYICLSLPLQRVHPEGECNPDTVRFLSQEPADEEAGDTNSPFAALKGLFDEK